MPSDDAVQGQSRSALLEVIASTFFLSFVVVV
jgi:hypothetical protein